MQLPFFLSVVCDSDRHENVIIFSINLQSCKCMQVSKYFSYNNILEKSCASERACSIVVGKTPHRRRNDNRRPIF